MLFGRVATIPSVWASSSAIGRCPCESCSPASTLQVDRYARRLPELDAAAVDRRGAHTTLGDMTVAQMLERFVVSHLEDNARQLEASLEASGR